MNRMTFDFTQKQFYESVVRMAKEGKLAYMVPATDEVEAHLQEISVEDLEKYAGYKVEQLENRAKTSRETAAKKKAEDPFLERVFDAVSDEFETTDAILERVELAEGEKFTKQMATSRLTALVKAGKVEKKTISEKYTDAEGHSKTRKPMAYKRVSVAETADDAE